VSFSRGKVTIPGMIRLSVKWRLLIAFGLVCLQLLYLPVNRLASGGVTLQTTVDKAIPLYPIWVVPYLLALPWWLAGLLWAAIRMQGRLYRAFVIATAFAILVGTLIYIFFPTYEPRPSITPTGWAGDLLLRVYQNDRPYNAFPSSHTYLTALISFFFWRWKPRLALLWLGILVVVLLSTLFTWQHSLLDLAGGLFLAGAGAWLGLHLTRHASREESI
jgi:membrane-associated phospholipid phosphatase